MNWVPKIFVFWNFHLSENILLIKKTSPHPIHRCTLCGEGFVDENTIKKHITTFHGTELTENSCRTCGKHCKDSRSLVKHAWDHSREKKHCCAKCGKNFHNKARLKRHMQSHRNKSVTCNICGEDFPDGRSLMNHRHSHTNISGRQFPCRECGKTFGSRSSQQIHMRIHTGGFRLIDSYELNIWIKFPILGLLLSRFRYFILTKIRFQGNDLTDADFAGRHLLTAVHYENMNVFTRVSNHSFFNFRSYSCLSATTKKHFKKFRIIFYSEKQEKSHMPVRYALAHSTNALFCVSISALIIPVWIPQTEIV